MHTKEIQKKKKKARKKQTGALCTKNEERLILAHFLFEPSETGMFLARHQFIYTEFNSDSRCHIIMKYCWSLYQKEKKFGLTSFLDYISKKSFGGDSLLSFLGNEKHIGELFGDPFKFFGVKYYEDLGPILERLREINTLRAAHHCFKKYQKVLENPEVEFSNEIVNSIWELQRIMDRGPEFYWSNLGNHVSKLRRLIQKNKQKKSIFIGLDFEFPILSEILNGLQNEFYIVTGTSGMGKTSFVTQIAWSVLNLNPESYVVFISLDLNAIDVTARFVAHNAQIDLQYIKNPAIANIALEKKRQQAMHDVSLLKERTSIIDENKGPVFLEDIKKNIQSIRANTDTEILLVIDTLDAIHSRRFNYNHDLERKVNFLSGELRTLARMENISVLATTGMLKYNESNRPQLRDLDHVVRLLYDPYVILTLYQDTKVDAESPFQEWEWGDEGLMVPIVELNIVKNKMGQDKKNIYYRFFEPYGRFKECHQEENRNYDAMLASLTKHEKEKKEPLPKYRPV
ncbi:DnaB-like helicase C-terminal domain-containing protein [Candidatus Riflebacteria bacterium]